MKFKRRYLDGDHANPFYLRTNPVDYSYTYFGCGMYFNYSGEFELTDTMFCVEQYAYMVILKI